MMAKAVVEVAQPIPFRGPFFYDPGQFEQQQRQPQQQ